MLIYCLFSGKDTYLVSLFANTAGIMPEIDIGMKSFVSLALAIIAGVLIINLYVQDVGTLRQQWSFVKIGTLRQQWSFVKIGKMNIYGNKNGAAEKPKTFGQHRLSRSIVLRFYLRYFLKNASIRSNGMMSIRSYKSVWLAPGIISSSLLSPFNLPKASWEAGSE